MGIRVLTRHRVVNGQGCERLPPDTQHQQNHRLLIPAKRNNFAGGLRDLHRRLTITSNGHETCYRTAAGFDPDGISGQSTLAHQHPERADCGVTAHLHLMVGHEKTKREIVIAALRREDQSRLTPEATRDVLHVGGAHTVCASHDGTRVAPCSSYVKTLTR